MQQSSASVSATHLTGQAGNLAIWADDKAGRGIVKVDVIGGELISVLSREGRCLRHSYMTPLAGSASAILRLHQQTCTIQHPHLCNSWLLLCMLEITAGMLCRGCT